MTTTITSTKRPPSPLQPPRELSNPSRKKTMVLTHFRFRRRTRTRRSIREALLKKSGTSTLSDRRYSVAELVIYGLFVLRQASQKNMFTCDIRVFPICIKYRIDRICRIVFLVILKMKITQNSILRVFN